MNEHETQGTSWRTASWLAPEAVGRLGRRAWVVAVVGIALTALGYFAAGDGQFFQSYLTAYVYWVGLALGCLGVSMIHHLSGGSWGLVIRRVLEAASRTLPVMLLLFLPLLAGLSHLYPWARPDEVAADELLQHKEPYLNAGFFTGRAVLYFAVWIALAWVLSRLSKQQDATGEPALARRMRTAAAPGLVLFGLAVTFAAFDWLMSLDPHWYSTIYGAYFLGGFGLTAFAFIVVVALFLSRREPMSRAFGRRHFHDYGKLMLAFVMLWAYFAFSQFLIIWSGNLPGEIDYFLERTANGWQLLALALIVAHFALPFVLLLSRDLKRHGRALVWVALLVLIMRWVDIYWQVGPAFHPEQIAPHWLDLATMLALGGIWVALFARMLESRPLLPVNAPHLEEALGDE